MFSFSRKYKTTNMLRRNAAKLQKKATPGELSLRAYSRCITKGKIFFQYPIAGLERSGYILDFAIPALRIGIEVDGGYHLYPIVKAKDVARSAELNARGWIVMRVQDSACLLDPATVAKALANAIFGASRMRCDDVYDGIVSIDWHPCQMPGPKPRPEDRPIRVLASVRQQPPQRFRKRASPDKNRRKGLI